jgi:hypothetical protein
MSWKAQNQKIYEERMIKESLTRLSDSFGMEIIPFSKDELWTLAKRHREAFFGSDKKKERLAKYIAHLSAIHSDEVVSQVSSKLQDINNRIGYEEK